MLSPSWRADAGLIGVAVVLGGLFWWDRLVTDQPGALTLAGDAALGVLSCAVLQLRRRWPVWVALAVIPSIVVSSASLGATAVSMSAVALYRPRRVAAAVAGAHALLLAAIFIPLGEPMWEGLIALLAMDAAMLAFGWLVRSERQRQLTTEREAKATAQARADEARHSERERIAREMHDVLAHRLSLLVVYAGALEVRKSAPAEEREAAGVIRQGAFAALEDLREVIWMLRDPESHAGNRPQPTLTDVPNLIEQSRLAGTEVSYDNRIADPEAVTANVGRHLYRVVQEGLTNARKHAPDSPVRVRLAGDDHGLTVEIVNRTGQAISIPGAGAGLAGLRERMTLLGGRLDFGCAAAGEFQLLAWIPSQL